MRIGCPLWPFSSECWRRFNLLVLTFWNRTAPSGHWGQGLAELTPVVAAPFGYMYDVVGGAASDARLSQVLYLPLVTDVYATWGA